MNLGSVFVHDSAFLFLLFSFFFFPLALALILVFVCVYLGVLKISNTKYQDQ